jgi:hypothetical protein
MKKKEKLEEQNEFLSSLLASLEDVKQGRVSDVPLKKKLVKIR